VRVAGAMQQPQQPSLNNGGQRKHGEKGTRRDKLKKAVQSIATILQFDLLHSSRIRRLASSGNRPGSTR
jgi:hypothetical protein